MRRLTADRLESRTSPRRVSEESAHAGIASTAADPAEALRVQQQLAFDAARERGHAEGLKEAEEQIAAAVEKIAARLREEHSAAVALQQEERKRLQHLATSLQSALAAYAVDAETLAVEVAFAAVVRLLGDRAADRSLMLDLCRVVAREYGHPPATLRVNESDLERLDASALDIPVAADRRLLPGQCVIETARGQFEVGLDVRLDELRKSLLSALAEQRSAS